MKKRILLGFLMILSLILIPKTTFAANLDLTGTTKETLEEAFNADSITGYDLSNYSETGDKVVIYLFRKDGCINCKNFLNYIKETLLPKYGDKFKVTSYEVSQNQSNNILANKVRAFFNEDVSSSYYTPYVVVGNQKFSGAISNDAKTQIENIINSNVKYDVLSEMQNGVSNINTKTNFTDNNVTFLSNEALNNAYTLKVTTIDKSNLALENYNYIIAYDISMYSGNSIVSMNNGSYKISIPMDNKYKTYKVAYINNNKIIETLDGVYENGFVSFNTTHLSEYAVYGTNGNIIEGNEVNEKNPQTLDKIGIYFIMLSVGVFVSLSSLLILKKSKSSM